MADSILTPANMAEWLEVLDRIDVSISHALDETAEYERALASTAVPAATPELSDDASLRGLRLHLDAAGRLADTVEALLATDEGEARAWVGLANQVNDRLATPVGGI